jgi:hypothetical protein
MPLPALHATRIDEWKHLPLYSHRYQDSPIVYPYSPWPALPVSLSRLLSFLQWRNLGQEGDREHPGTGRAAASERVSARRTGQKSD